MKPSRSVCISEMILPKNLADLLLPWYWANRRALPWRETTDPYRIWLSEIMLQQTRVETAKAYYLRFLDALPDIRALSECPEEQLLKLWEGLGYYSRARNLQKAAKRIMAEYDGHFPREPEKVRSLPGIGAYTAGAICSICFDLPTPAVDGNVLRVCTRLTASRDDVSSAPFKQEVALALLPCFLRNNCGDFNQALMELGATICIPRGMPQCTVCPLASACLSRENELWREIPVLSPKKARQREEIAVFLLHCAERHALQKRPSSGILAGLWEYPSLPGLFTPQQALDQAAAWGCLPSVLVKITEREHIFTHRVWHMTGYEIQCAAMPDRFRWANPQELDEIYSLPSAFRKFDETNDRRPRTARRKGELRMKSKIESKSAPAAIGPYSQATIAGNTAYVSGMLGIDPATGELKEGVEAQAEQALQNLEAVLKEAELTTASVVKTTVFLTDMGAFSQVNAIYSKHFSAPYPARSCVQVSALPKGGLFEIEAIAVRG